MIVVDGCSTNNEPSIHEMKSKRKRWSVPRKSWTGNKDGTFPMRLTSARREWAPPKLVGAGRGCAGYGVPFAVNPQPIHSLS